MELLNGIRARFRKLPQTEKVALKKQILHDATPGLSFYLYVFLSGTIATLGLLTNSSPVIIGAMLLAPLMSPIIGIGLSTVIGDWGLLKSSLVSLLRGALLAVTLSAIITLINTVLPFVSLQDFGNEILSRTKPTPIDLVIAIAGGLGGAYAITKRDISAALPGVAIATALMPPLGVIGIGLASLQWRVAFGAFLLFITNSAAIAFAAGIIFFLVGFGSQKNRYQLEDRSDHLPASMIISSIMVILLILPLTIFALSGFQSSSIENTLTDLVSAELEKAAVIEDVHTQISRENRAYVIEVTIQTPEYLGEERLSELFAVIQSTVDQPVQLRVHQILVMSTQLDRD